MFSVGLFPALVLVLALAEKGFAGNCQVRQAASDAFWFVFPFSATSHSLCLILLQTQYSLYAYVAHLVLYLDFAL